MASGSYWCYSCSRFVWVSNPLSVTCPNCNGGFVEEIQEPAAFTHSDSYHHRRSTTRFPSTAMNLTGNAATTAAATTAWDGPNSIVGQTRRIGDDRSPMNPVIVLRRSDRNLSGFQLYYDDGMESGLRSLPPSMTGFLLGSGFDLLLDQISHTELNTNRNSRTRDHPPASKSTIESLPVIEIDPTHLESDSRSHCAVCKEVFVLRSMAREMPCNHIYHSDCILPWLALRSSCPVCRHEIPADDGGREDGDSGSAGGDVEDEAAGLTIWRLPGGGFAVGRIPIGRRGGDGVMPVVYTEMDRGRFNDERLQRRVLWGSRGGEEGGRRTGGGVVGRVMRHLFGCFGGSVSGSESWSDSTDTRRSRSFDTST